MTHRIQCFSLFILLSLAVAVVAQVQAQAMPDHWLKVELIAFEQPQAKQARSSEQWPEQPGIPNSSKASSLAEGTDYQALSPEQWEMQPLEDILDKQGRYKVLLHTAWIQPNPQQNSAKAVYLDNRLAQTPWSDDSVVLSGVISISHSRYPHAQIDLLFEEQAKPQEDLSKLPHDSSYFFDHRQLPNSYPVIESEHQEKSFRLQTKTRLKFDKPTYIDHPVVGLIIKVSDYLKPEPQPDKIAETRIQIRNATRP